MQINIDEKKILTEVIEMDGSLHQKIKECVEERLINEVVAEIENEFVKSSIWGQRTDEIHNRILENLEEKQTEMVKKVLKEFYESYRYKKDNLAILKKLKDFLGEN